MLVGALLLSSVALAVPCGFRNVTATSPDGRAEQVPTDAPLLLQFGGCEEKGSVRVKLDALDADDHAVPVLDTVVEAVPGCAAPVVVPGGLAPSTTYRVELGPPDGTWMTFRTGSAASAPLPKLTCDTTVTIPTPPEPRRGEWECGNARAAERMSAKEPESALTFSCSTSAGRPGAALLALALLAVRRRRDA